MSVRNNEFMEKINNDYLDYIKKQEKAEFHNHATTSCHLDFLREKGLNVPSEQNIYDIQSLINFSRQYITPLEMNADTLRILLDGNFQNCIETGIKVVNTSIDYKICMRSFNGNIDKFINFLKSFNYGNLTILWDIAISRDSYNEEHRNLLLDLIKSKFFAGIDLVSTENIQPNSTFVEFYNLANKLGMITKVHAGEQLGSEYVRECILDFNPKQIQHGITIVEDEEVMRLAKEKEIIFNVCPTSNVILGYAKSIKEHPIKRMVEFGLRVTIGTDDLLFFNSDINNEYNLLFVNKVLTMDQLERIRKCGLSLVEKEDN